MAMTWGQLTRGMMLAGAAAAGVAGAPMPAAARESAPAWSAQVGRWEVEGERRGRVFFACTATRVVPLASARLVENKDDPLYAIPRDGIAVEFLSLVTRQLSGPYRAGTGIHVSPLVVDDGENYRLSLRSGNQTMTFTGRVRDGVAAFQVPLARSRALLDALSRRAPASLAITRDGREIAAFDLPVDDFAEAVALRAACMTEMLDDAGVLP